MTMQTCYSHPCTCPLPHKPRPKGDSFDYRVAVPTYGGAHERVYSKHGAVKQRRCVECGGQARQWAYDHADPDELRDDKGRLYSADPDHYQPMCVSCHMKFDASHAPATITKV